MPVNLDFPLTGFRDAGEMAAERTMTPQWLTIGQCIDKIRKAGPK